jgi:hypothetical protein
MERMTIEEMHAKLKSIGMLLEYFPIWNNESECIELRTLREEIVDGKLVGSMISLNKDCSLVNVLTPKKQKAKALAKAMVFKVRLLDGEAELFIPPVHADAYLRLFGARVKRHMSPEALAKRQASALRMVAARKKSLAIAS